jgi:hypothetical protein
MIAGLFSGPLQIEGQELPPNAPRPQVNFYVASPDYFAHNRNQPLLAGRTFTRIRRGSDRPVVIINKTMGPALLAKTRIRLSKRISGRRADLV